MFMVYMVTFLFSFFASQSVIIFCLLHYFSLLLLSHFMRATSVQCNAQSQLLVYKCRLLELQYERHLINLFS